MKSFVSTRRIAASVGVGAALAMATIGACSTNAENQGPASPADSTSTTSNTIVSSVSSQLSSIISSVRPT
jgi:hypothetical protein